MCFLFFVNFLSPKTNTPLSLSHHAAWDRDIYFGQGLRATHYTAKPLLRKSDRFRGRCCVVGARGRAGDLKSEREGRIKKLFLSLSIDHFTVL